MKAEQVVSDLASRRGFLKAAGAFAGLVAGADLVGFDKAFAAPLSTDTVQDILNGAVTAERIAVTFQYTALNTVLAANNAATASSLGGQTNLNNVRIQIQTILDAERYHRDQLATGFNAQALAGASAFYFPAGTFDNLTNYANVAILLETAFVGAYMVGAAEFAQRGAIDAAVIAGQILGIEAEHRVLSRGLLNLTPASELSHERYKFTSLGNLSAGVGGLDPGSAVRALAPFVLGPAYVLPGQTFVSTTTPMPADADINGPNGTGGRTAIKPPFGAISTV